MSQDINDLLNGALDEGTIDQDMMDAFNVVDLGDTLQDNLGVSPDQIDANDPFGFFGIVDDSSSIRFAGNTSNVTTPG